MALNAIRPHRGCGRRERGARDRPAYMAHLVEPATHLDIRAGGLARDLDEIREDQERRKDGEAHDDRPTARPGQPGGRNEAAKGERAMRVAPDGKAHEEQPEEWRAPQGPHDEIDNTQTKHFQYPQRIVKQ